MLGDRPLSVVRVLARHIGWSTWLKSQWPGATGYSIVGMTYVYHSPATADVCCNGKSSSSSAVGKEREEGCGLCFCVSLSLTLAG